MLAVALALAASVSWGSADFLGGLTTRRATLWAVVVGSQAVGLAGAALVVVLADRPWIGFGGLWPVLVGGLAGSVAVVTFYRALAIGTMSVVAPISATSALIPFLWGLAGGERPTGLQLAGVALAVAGVLLASVEGSRRGAAVGAGTLPGEPAIGSPPHEAAIRHDAGVTPDGPPDDPPRGPLGSQPDGPSGSGPATSRSQQRRAVALALVAAVGIGIMLLGFDATAKHDPLWAMLGGRLSSACCFAAFLVVLRPRVRIPRSTVAPIVAVGLLDTGANGLFALATTRGYLSLVGVLGSLYPVVTVVLAYLVLRERLARHQLAGVLAALAGVALIAVH
jgi:drug/metabolite transporter (DMT)-like permease